MSSFDIFIFWHIPFLILNYFMKNKFREKFSKNPPQKFMMSTKCHKEDFLVNFRNKCLLVAKVNSCYKSSRDFWGFSAVSFFTFQMGAVLIVSNSSLCSNVHLETRFSKFYCIKRTLGNTLIIPKNYSGLVANMLFWRLSMRFCSSAKNGPKISISSIIQN